MDPTKVIQMLQHIYDMLETADDPDDIQEIQHEVSSYLKDLQSDSGMSEQEAGLREDMGTDKGYPSFDEDADDSTQGHYFSKAYDVLKANPKLLEMYDTEPQGRLGEELYDIDNNNPNGNYTTLREFIKNNKFNIPIERYTKKPVDYLGNVLALINNKPKEMGLDAVKPKDDSVPEQIEGLTDLLKGW